MRVVHVQRASIATILFVAIVPNHMFYCGPHYNYIIINNTNKHTEGLANSFQTPNKKTKTKQKSRFCILRNCKGSVSVPTGDVWVCSKGIFSNVCWGVELAWASEICLLRKLLHVWNIHHHPSHLPRSRMNKKTKKRNIYIS